ncbi:MAG: hypothetical protein M1371_01910 [Actinobacteria bacterium]|nr:hypothetical protein [Actinomycetota bacterium]
MKRKQYYITKEQDLLIKEKALKWKIPEAEIIRKKIDELKETYIAEIKPDAQKFLRHLKETEKLRKAGHYKIGKFERDKLYEDRIPRGH